MVGELDELAAILSSQPDFEKAATDTATGKRGRGRPRGWMAKEIPDYVLRRPTRIRVNDDVMTVDPETLSRDRQTILQIYRPRKSKGRAARLALLEELFNSNPALRRLTSASACAAHLIKSQPAFKAQKFDSLRKDVAAVRKKLARHLG